MNSSDLIKACLTKIEQTKARVVYLLGANSSGKTTLTKLIANQLISEDKLVTIIDADSGQSSRLPLTLSLNYADKQFEEFTELKLIAWDFIPSYDLLKWFERYIELLKKWIERARRETNYCLIDSNGDIREALKLKEIKAINPDLIIALQKKAELEPILQELTQVVKLPISIRARRRSAKLRKGKRNEKFKSYFNDCTTQEIEYEPSSDWENKVIGLYAQEKFLGLGIAKDKKEGKLIVATPVRAKADKIELSSIKMDHKKGEV